LGSDGNDLGSRMSEEAKVAGGGRWGEVDLRKRRGEDVRVSVMMMRASLASQDMRMVEFPVACASMRWYMWVRTLETTARVPARRGFLRHIVGLREG
jgi:hypothetical protein